MLTFRFQKELAKVGNVTASTVHHDVANNGATASGVRNDAVNTPTIVSDIHRNKLKRSEDVRSRDLGVSTIHALLFAE